MRKSLRVHAVTGGEHRTPATPATTLEEAEERRAEWSQLDPLVNYGPEEKEASGRTKEDRANTKDKSSWICPSWKIAPPEEESHPESAGGVERSFGKQWL